MAITRNLYVMFRFNNFGACIKTLASVNYAQNTYTAGNKLL